MQSDGQDSSDSETEVSAESRHPSLYFPDGDVILSLKDASGGRIMYRLDRSLLSRHSAVFASMFNLPSALGANEEYDCAPVVPLEDDADAMEDLLQFMYNPAALVFEKHDSDTPVRGSKLLEVAHKYQIEGVRPFIVRQIENDWPTTLVQWHQWQGEVARLDDLKATLQEVVEEIDPDDEYPEPAGAIRFALDHNLPSILPAAFYTLASINADADYDRVRGGEWVFGGEGGGSVEYTWERSARWSLLDRDSLYHVMVGARTLQRCTSSLRKVYGIQDTCIIAQCKNERNNLSQRHATYTKDLPRPRDPLEVLVKMSAKLDGHPKLCPACKKMIRTEMEKEMTRIWDDIPEIFAIEVLTEK